MRQGNTLSGLFFVLIFGGLSATWSYRLLDRSPKLSFTTDGLQDHRTGIFVKWTEIRGARLEATTYRGIESLAYLFIKIDRVGNIGEEISIEVDSLDRGSKEILRLVERWTQDAIKQSR